MVGRVKSLAEPCTWMRGGGSPVLSVLAAGLDVREAAVIRALLLDFHSILIVQADLCTLSCKVSNSLNWAGHSNKQLHVSACRHQSYQAGFLACPVPAASSWRECRALLQRHKLSLTANIYIELYGR